MFSHHSTTQKRRALQPLWNALDTVVLPHWQTKGMVLAISGGVDSRALLEACATWKNRDKGNIVVVTVDHGTRPETPQEALRVLGRARLLGFNAFSCALEKVSSLNESALREQRYAALWKIAHEQNCYILCVAHHQNDDAEGFVLDMLGYGGGREGATMGAVVQQAAGLVLRPFLHVSKMQLQCAVWARGSTDAFQDPLDKKGSGKRAQVRHSILPVLEAHHGNMGERLARKSRQKGVALALLDHTAEQLLEKSEGTIRINLAQVSDGTFVEHALALAIKSLVPDQDCRNARPTVEKIAKMIQTLDRGAKLVTLDNLQLKTFTVLGVSIEVQQSSLLLKKMHGISDTLGNKGSRTYKQRGSQP